MTIAQELSAFACRTARRALPSDVAERVRLCVADHLHAAIQGARSDTGTLVRRYIGGSQAGAEPTALLLGALSTVYEIDDVHRDTSMHPGSVIAAAALGAASDTPVDDRRLTAAIAIGYEVAIRLSIAAGERHYHYFHSTATCGTVGAAAAAAVVYGLDEQQTAHALGIAVTSASGLWEDINNGAIVVKHLHSGFAAERGVRAARLAQLGARGARESIEGEKGFLAALARPHAGAARETAASPGQVRQILLDGLGTRWAVLRNIYKRYPFCLGCFEPIEGIRHIISSSGRAASHVASVTVELYPPVASLIGQDDPRDQLQAKFSGKFAIALVLAGHDPENVLLPVEWLTDPAVRWWYPKITRTADPSLTPRHARVTVAWTDGTTMSADKPLRSLDGDEVLARFVNAVRRHLGPRGSILEQRIARLGELGNAADLAILAREAVGA